MPMPMAEHVEKSSIIDLFNKSAVNLRVCRPSIGIENIENKIGCKTGASPDSATLNKNYAVFSKVLKILDYNLSAEKSLVLGSPAASSLDIISPTFLCIYASYNSPNFGSDIQKQLGSVPEKEN